MSKYVPAYGEHRFDHRPTQPNFKMPTKPTKAKKLMKPRDHIKDGIHITLLPDETGLVWRTPEIGEVYDYHEWNGEAWEELPNIYNVGGKNTQVHTGTKYGPWTFDRDNWVYNTTVKPTEDGTRINEINGSWIWNGTEWIDIPDTHGGRRNKSRNKRKSKNKRNKSKNKRNKRRK